MPNPVILITLSTTLLSAWPLPVGVQAFPNFRDQIPNGRRVPSPCLRFFTVPGVGHLNPFGSGPRNNFGMAFAAAGFNWTTTLCQADSDGDGITNGQELGDVNCTWTPGDEPSRTTQISHPGINNLRPDCFRRFIRFLLRPRPRPRPRPPRPTRPPTNTTTANTTLDDNFIP